MTVTISVEEDRWQYVYIIQFSNHADRQHQFYRPLSTSLEQYIHMYIDKTDHCTKGKLFYPNTS